MHVLPGPTTAYLVGGMPVRVCADGDVADWVLPVLRACGRPAHVGGPVAVVRIRSVPARPPAEGRAVATVGALTLRARGADRFIEGVRVTTRVDPEASEADVYVPRGGSAGLRLEAQVHLTTSFAVLLRERGGFVLHAAALVSDAGGVLVVGPSDVGKSTLSYTLVRAGWSAVSDDSVVLQRGPAGVAVLPLRRAFGLDPDAADRFPEIRAHARPQPGDPGKWSVDVAAIHPGRLAESCVPGAVVFPEITGERESALVPLRAPDAFLRLAAQSALRGATDGRAPEHHAVFADLLGHARPARLRAGTDLLDPATADRVLRRALDPRHPDD